jgi:hypothetical protein
MKEGATGLEPAPVEANPQIHILNLVNLRSKGAFCEYASLGKNSSACLPQRRRTVKT